LLKEIEFLPKLVSNQLTISLLQQVEISADMLITQLVQVKDNAARLREDLAGVSTPAVRKGQVLTDEQTAKLLVDRKRRLIKRNPKIK
jgi:hypothetical protein